MPRVPIAWIATAICWLFPLSGQTTTGRIVGTVTDPSGAALPNVQVQVTSVETNESRLTLTSAEGGYVFANIGIGVYELSAEAPGFKRFLQSPIQLLVDQVVRVDIRMALGDVAEQVTVSGEVPLIETERSGIGKVVENATIVELPLNGRHFVRLASLIPGTTRGNPGASNAFRNYGETFTSNGQRSEYNNYMLDGTNNNAYIIGTAVIVPSVDAVQEFKVQTSNYSAEFGRGAGAVVNLAIKSGTNSFHGSAYEFLRNDQIKARNFFDAGRQPLRFNQFGASLGGVIRRDRTFFFVNYEGWRERRAATRGTVVPIDAMKSGNFAGQPTIYDPLNLDAAGNRIPFAENRIPSGRIHPIAGKLLARWASPNSTDPARNYLQNFTDAVNRDQAHIRIDHLLTARDHLMGRYSHWNSDYDQPNFIYSGQLWQHYPRNGVLGWTRTWTPRLVQESRVAYTRYSELILPQGYGQEFASAVGLPSRPLAGELFHPVITVTNLQMMGGQDSVSRRIENHYQVVSQASLTQGRHTVKFGGDILRYQSASGFATAENGVYSFSGAFTGPRGSQYRTGFADFLLGLPVSQQLLNTDFFDYGRLRNTRIQLYVQDDINVRPSLTLNVGLRWEGDPGWIEKNNRFGYFDYTAGQYVYPKALKLPFSIPFSHRFEDLSGARTARLRFFAPRFGFAWRPFGNNRTVVRSAYGIFYGVPLGLVLFNATFRAPGLLLLEQQTSSNLIPELTWGSFAASAGSLVPRNPTFFTANPYTLTDPYVQQWNFGIERQLMTDTAVRISYVGSKSTHLERRFQGNGALPPAPGPINPRRLYPEFAGFTEQQSTSWATYHSLQVSAERRMSKGLIFIAGYTWSKAIDDNSGWSSGTQDSSNAQNPWRLDLEKGLSAMDVRHRFTFTWVYQIPFHSGSALARQVLGGWETGGIVTLQTGFAFTVFVPGDIPNTGTGSVRADVIGPGNLASGERTIDRWFDTAAFAAPPPYQFGNSGRNNLDGPGLRDFDFGLMKIFRIAEQHRLQFRSEFFNLFNHPNFGIPNTSFGNSGFGTIRSGGLGREVQFGFKYLF